MDTDHNADEIRFSMSHNPPPISTETDIMKSIYGPPTESSSLEMSKQKYPTVYRSPAPYKSLSASKARNHYDRSTQSPKKIMNTENSIKSSSAAMFDVIQNAINKYNEEAVIANRPIRYKVDMSPTGVKISAAGISSNEEKSSYSELRGFTSGEGIPLSRHSKGGQNLINNGNEYLLSFTVDVDNEFITVNKVNREETSEESSSKSYKVAINGESNSELDSIDDYSHLFTYNKSENHNSSHDLVAMESLAENRRIKSHELGINEHENDYPQINLYKRLSEESLKIAADKEYVNLNRRVKRQIQNVHPTQFIISDRRIIAATPALHETSKPNYNDSSSEFIERLDPLITPSSQGMTVEENKSNLFDNANIDKNISSGSKLVYSAAEQIFTRLKSLFRDKFEKPKHFERSEGSPLHGNSSPITILHILGPAQLLIGAETLEQNRKDLDDFASKDFDEYFAQNNLPAFRERKKRLHSTYKITNTMKNILEYRNFLFLMMG